MGACSHHDHVTEDERMPSYVCAASNMCALHRSTVDGVGVAAEYAAHVAK